MCTALVVREEYWDKQFRICANLCGIDLGDLQLNVIKFYKDYYNDTMISVKKLIEACIKAFVAFKNTLKETIEILSELFKSCEVTSKDSSDVVCDKLENRMMCINRQECIKQEQYYKEYFKAVKINYNIMNHNKRC